MRRTPALAMLALALAVPSACSNDSAKDEPDRAASSLSEGTSADIEGEWALTALVDKDGQSVLTGRLADKVRIRFFGGKMSGTTGCNSVFAEYKQDGSDGRDIEFLDHTLGSTAVLCSDEPPLMDRIPDVRHISEADGKLQLHAENNTIIAVLERATVEPAIGLPAAEIATYEPTGASAEALAHGTLIISNGCLVLGNETDAQLIIFDATTTTLSFDGQTLRTTDERGNKVSVQVGDRLSFAGGNGPVPEDRSRVTIPTACENAAKKEAFYTHGIGRAFPID